jgi:hypothetical protein
MSIDSATKILKDAKEMTVVDIGGSGHELTQDVNDIKNIIRSDAKINKTIDEVTLASGILKRNTIYGTKTRVKLHRSVHRTIISETRMIKKIMNVLSLGEAIAVRCGCHLNPKKVAKRAQGNILRIIPHDDHIIHIEKNKGTTTRKV